MVSRGGYWRNPATSPARTVTMVSETNSRRPVTDPGGGFRHWESDRGSRARIEPPPESKFNSQRLSDDGHDFFKNQEAESRLRGVDRRANGDLEDENERLGSTGHPHVRFVFQMRSDPQELADGDGISPEDRSIDLLFQEFEERMDRRFKSFEARWDQKNDMMIEMIRQLNPDSNVQEKDRRAILEENESDEDDDEDEYDSLQHSLRRFSSESRSCDGSGYENSDIESLIEERIKSAAQARSRQFATSRKNKLEAKQNTLKEARMVKIVNRLESEEAAIYKWDRDDYPLRTPSRAVRSPSIVRGLLKRSSPIRVNSQGMSFDQDSPSTFDSTPIWDVEDEGDDDDELLDEFCDEDVRKVGIDDGVRLDAEEKWINSEKVVAYGVVVQATVSNMQE